MVKTVGIVSLSSGVLGESFVAHELKIGEERLRALGLSVKYMPHAKMGMAYLRAHPEARAADLLAAFRDPEVDMILCAIGGDDTYKLAPYLFENDALQKAVTDKIFLGFSDTTVNHFMLHKVGLPTFYGQAFLPDVCELGTDMLPYTRRYFEELIRTGHIAAVTPSDTWYETRKNFGADQVGTAMPAYKNDGFELLRGHARFEGEILGGCIDTLFDMFDGTRYADMPDVIRRYGLFPAAGAWRGKILLLESSEEKPSPEKYRRALEYLRDAGVFAAVSGVLVGKPMDDTHHAAYKQALLDIIPDMELPIVCNLSVGHAQPRCILPFGVHATVDADTQRITFAF